jgi:hypothetical protein
MTSLIDCIRVRYRAAVYLNNSAVTLLKRDYYNDAVETFRVSINIIQAIIEDMKNPNKVEVSSMSTVYNDINRQVQDASHRCASACLPTGITASQSGGKLAVLKFYSQQDPSTFIDEIVEESRYSTSNGYTFVIIEPLNEDEICLELLGLDCYSVLYNFGVAHCLLASQFSSNVRPDQMLIDELRQSAFRLFLLIEPFFLARLSWCPDESKLDDRNVLLLCALFAQAMSDVASQLQYATVCESYESTLQAFLSSIGHQETFIPTRSRPAPAA